MRIRNKPQQISRQEYDTAIDIYTERVKRLHGVVSIALMGSVNSPGLSDIDVVVVTDDSFSPESSLSLSTRAIDDRLFLHGPVVIPISMAPELQKLIYASNLETIFGENCLPDFHDLPPETKRTLAACYLIDFTESRFAQYAEVDLLREVDQRAWLTRTWSVNHSVTLLESISGKEISSEDRRLQDSIGKPRILWNRTQEIDETTFLEAFTSSRELNRSIFLKALSLFYDDNILDCPSLTVGAKKITFDRDTATPEYVVKQMALFGRKFSVYECRQISRYFSHINNYLPALGLEDKARRQNPLRKLNVSNIRQRAQLVVKHWRWLEKNAPLSGSLAGYLGFQPKRPIGIKAHLRHRIQQTMLT